MASFEEERCSSCSAYPSKKDAKEPKSIRFSTDVDFIDEGYEGLVSVLLALLEQIFVNQGGI
ncbi:hypothetical protein ACLOJK_018494, partial [Asimina triloba]